MRYIFVAFLLLTSGLVAEETRPQASEVPYVMMAKLAPLAGNWSVVRERTMDGGKTWTVYPKTMVQVQYKQKGLMLEETPLNMTEDGFHMAIYLSYDQYQQTYRQAAIEDYWGFMDISEGQLEDGVLVMTNTKSRTYYPMEEGRLRALKIRMELTSPSRMVYLDESYDDGKTWSPSFRMRFQLQP